TRRGDHRGPPGRRPRSRSRPPRRHGSRRRAARRRPAYSPPVHAALDAARQVWPAFALVTGLLLIGVVAERDGLFRWTGAFLAQLPLGARGLLAAAFALVAVVTALLNLDTAVFFL